MKLGSVLNGLSFDTSHIIPRGREKWSMSSTQQVNWASSSDRGDRVERSLIGKEQSLSNSSGESSGIVSPLYHFQPCSMIVPPLTAI